MGSFRRFAVEILESHLWLHVASRLQRIDRRPQHLGEQRLPGVAGSSQDVEQDLANDRVIAIDFRDLTAETNAGVVLVFDPPTSIAVVWIFERKGGNETSGCFSIL